MTKLEMPIEQFVRAVVKENERLRAALLGEETEHSRRIMEVERLRAALRPFACTCSVKGMGAGGNCTERTGECDCWNARAALGGKDE